MTNPLTTSPMPTALSGEGPPLDDRLRITPSDDRLRIAPSAIGPRGGVAAAEASLIEQYHGAVKEVESFEAAQKRVAAQLKKAKADRDRLYKIASVIDPSLKRTRPKSGE